ncbi:hypothetical protein PHYPSEUDO_015611 [Phytophthora pseudosyringae]|uniref:Uncharacterized protein n=1 Tax=Phytophthora pseudosyringae TaxID=221518 RepID=A0A8T1VZB9_9STRA|nr:hypothetical protein PHYPSEUDO_015611 [Phytophthora pseudosyringae]
METHRPAAGKVFCLPDGGFYVQACPQDVTFCPPIRVSPGLDAAAQGRRDDASSAALMDAVCAIDSDEQEEGEGEEEKEEVTDVAEAPAPSALRDGASLLDAVDAIDSDDDEELSVVLRRARRVLSGAALDLCPTVAPSEEESEEDDGDEDSEETASEEEESDRELVDKRPTLCAPRVSSWECDYLSVDQVDRMIRSNMAEIEAKKPWRFMFRCLAVPFTFKREEDPFDVFFMRWDEFWRLHGRAVWERAFWQPLLPGSTEYYRRKGRQSRAQRAFRELATDLAERIGDRYRRSLGKTLHEGWWYRTDPFPLRRLFVKDRRLYEEYLVRRVKERWPRGRKFLLERGLKPMWWLPQLHGW